MAASRFIDRYKGRDYLEHDHSETALVLTKYSKAIFRELIYLPYSPIIQITEVKVCDSVWIEGTEWDVVEGRLYSRQGYWIGTPDRSSPVNAWLSLFRNTELSRVEIKGRFGYEQRTGGALDTTKVPTGMPPDINQACVQIAAAISRLNTRDVVGLDGQKVGILETDIPKSAIQLLGARSKILI